MTHFKFVPYDETNHSKGGGGLVPITESNYRPGGEDLAVPSQITPNLDDAHLERLPCKHCERTYINEDMLARHVAKAHIDVDDS